MNKKIILIICGVIILGTLIVVLGRGINKNLISADLQIKTDSIDQPIPTPLPPTPTPVIFNKDSNLENELDNLIPVDFSQDFKNLKLEADKF